MRLVLRALATAIIAAAAIWLLLRLRAPIDCNRLEKAETLAMVRRADRAWTFRDATEARRANDRLRPCVARLQSVNVQMVIAANYRYLNAPDRAAEVYRRALAIDRRPELYINLGAALAEAGRAEEAMPFLIAGGLFRNDLLQDVPAPTGVEARQKVYELLEKPPAGGYVVP